MSKIKIGIIGCGFMSQAIHIPNFIANKKCEIVGVSDINEELSRLVAKKFNINFYKSYKEIFKEKSIDAVAIFVPPQLHPYLAMEAIELHKHTLIEKPLALNSKTGCELLKIAQKNKVKLMVGYMKRFDPGCQAAYKIIKELKQTNEIGPITYARVYNFNGANWESGCSSEVIRIASKVKEHVDLENLDIPKFVKLKHKKDYFGSFTNYSHDINLMRFLLGDPTRIIATNMRKGSHTSCARTVTIFDYKDFDVTLETGLEKSYYWNEGVHIYFEEGDMHIKLPFPLFKNVPAKVKLHKNNEGVKEFDIKWSWGFQEEVNHFIDCIQENKKPLTSADDSIKDIVIGESMYK
ncbi:MAG: Gfo/Idh/MocA family oxidoreductase, partial [Candidatus Firestonebacteria bacterium]